MNYEKSTYPVRIGKTTYIVSVRPSETAVKPLEEAFRDLCKKEALEENSSDSLMNLEAMKKSS